MIERIPFAPEEMKVLADLTVALVKLRQDECKHLAVENIGPEIFGKLMREVYQEPPMFITGSDKLDIHMPFDLGAGEQS